MKHAIMSDVHANPQALEAALADAKARGCGRFLMLGDTTGYGYDVIGALRLVRDAFDTVLLGNHDSACLGRESARIMKLCRNYDIDVAERALLTPDDRKWLGARPFTACVGDAALAHGDFRRPEDWGYIIRQTEAEASFAASSARLMFCGHTHEATAWERTDDGCRRKVRFERPAVKPESRSFLPKRRGRYIVNVGSVGYPRHDLCSTYVIWDDATDRITFRRLPFDFKAYITEMAAHGVALPGWLVEILLLASGRR